MYKKIAKLKKVGQTSWQWFWGLGLAITSVELSIRRVMAVPSCTGLPANPF